MKQQEKQSPLESHTRLSIMIHLLGMMLIGMALGLNAYPYLEEYIGFAIFGLPMLGLLFILYSVFLRMDS